MQKPEVSLNVGDIVLLRLSSDWVLEAHYETEDRVTIYNGLNGQAVGRLVTGQPEER